MKLFSYKKIALLLVLMLIAPIFWNQNIAVAQAATTPKFAQSKVEIVGESETYQLEIKDQVKGSKYKWTSLNTTVVKVTSKGLVTSVGMGSTSIKCVITYPTKKKKTITCKVTVTIPATEIKITNAVETNGTHMMKLGSTMNFDCSLVPVKSSDKVFWSVSETEGDSACLRIDDNVEGIVTATKAGKVVLVATAAKTATKAAADQSIIKDAVIIEVVGPTATVKSAEIVSGNEIKVVFDSPVNSNTVIGLNNKLSDNIQVTIGKDTKNVLAHDPGVLTASLSTDKTVLTITSANTLGGDYGIDFSNKILTTEGVALVSYYKRMSFTDAAPPSIINTTYDDSGMLATIHFSEAIDFTSFKVISATLASSSSVIASTTTLSTLMISSNYVISTDKKSMMINLSKITSTDYGKLFAVTFSGIKDMAGNAPSSYTLTAYLQTDNSLKPQARILSVVRTSYNILTATFDRAISIPGIATIAGGGATMTGVIDVTDPRKVNYTISDVEALYTGAKQVSIGYWDSYNVNPADTTARQLTIYYVDFTADVTSPSLDNFAYDATTKVLTLTYNEPVTLKIPIGIFSSTVKTAMDEILNGYNINYTNVVYTENNKVIKLTLANLTSIGNYTFTIDRGFVTDTFKNPSMSTPIVINNMAGTDTELPWPYLIAQSSSNLSQINLEFASKLDLTSAQTVSNYTIAGATILTAVVSKNTTDAGATVVLTVADGSLDYTVERPITIRGVKGYGNSLAAMTETTKMVELKDNKKPYFVDMPTFDTVSKNRIKLNFSEAIQGTLTIRVTQMATSSSIAFEIQNSVTISGNVAYINLLSNPSNGTYLKIEVISNTITDSSGNTLAPMSTTLGVAVTY